MEIVETTQANTEPSLKEQLAKLLIGMTAAFIATKLAEGAFDKFVESRRNKPIEEIN